MGFWLDVWVDGAGVGSCDLILTGESVEDESAVNLVVGEVGQVWGLGVLWLARCVGNGR